MKSILKSIALLSAAVLVASCDSSSGGGSAAVVTPPAPQISTAGSGTKGIMIGSTVVITDAAGAELGRSTTGADGSYSVALVNSTQGGTINGPLTVTITGGQTICDFDNAGTANDCPTGNPAPNNFVAFGTTYDLPATFAIRSQVAAPSTGAVSHITPLTEFATLKAIETAGTTAPTAAQVTTSLRAISGLVEAVSGVSLGGVDISQFQPADLTNTGGTNASPVALALAGLSASIVGAQGANESLAATITRLAALITIDANGNVSGTGTNLGILVSAFARGLAVAANASGNGVLAQAANNASNLANTYTNLGNATVTVPPLSVPGDNTAGVATKAFVTKLAQAVADVTSATGAQGAGEDGSVGATEAFATELDTIATLTGGNATTAFSRLDADLRAAAAALAAGESVTDAVEAGDADDGVEYVLTKAADGTLTATGVSSRWPLASTAQNNQVTLTADTASSTTTAINLDNVVVTTRQGTTVVQTFTGSATNTFDPAAGTDSPTFTGTITTSGATATASSFGIDASGTAIPRTGTGGTYTATFTFNATGTANDLTLTINGTVGASLQNFTIISASNTGATPAGITGTVTRTGTTDVNTLTDGSATLTLTVTNGSVVADANGIIGTFTEGTGEAQVTTATLNNTGVVTFTDGSILLLPSIIFIPDN